MKTRTIAACMAAALMAVSAAGLQANAQETPANKSYTSHETLSCIGSVSKTYTAVAIMQLADQGKLEIDKPVTEYLPEFTMADPRYKDITVRMLLNHSSGIMGTTAGDFMLNDDRDQATHDTLLQELRTQRLKADPGDFAAYCNDGFTLAELVVEAVSGQSFTEYVEQHICKPIGAEQTGTPWNAYRTEEQVPIFIRGNVAYAADYCMAIGSGGILSTARELCSFGSTFFKGDTRLLSEQAKREMMQCTMPADYEDGYGLGFDSVSFSDYEAAGVKVVAKGGDVQQQHAALVVAPDEEISVAVLSAGGGSMYNELLAMKLMDIALDEKGIEIEHPKPVTPETVDAVPEKYLAYADVYASADGIALVEFPEQKYMRITVLSEKGSVVSEYLYTADDSFVLMDGKIESGKAMPSRNHEVLQFRQRNGCDYLVADMNMECGSLGGFGMEVYKLQRVGQYETKDQAAWDARSGKKYYLSSARYSNGYYAEMPCAELQTYPEARGYVNGCKIVDATHAKAVLAMPGGRDLQDLEIRTENGVEVLDFTNNALLYVAEESIPELDSSVTEIALHTCRAGWYRLGDAENRTIMLDIPEHAAVYVYDAHDRMTYSSYMTQYGNKVPLPAGGKIVFLGEDGGTIGITQ